MEQTWGGTHIWADAAHGPDDIITRWQFDNEQREKELTGPEWTRVADLGPTHLPEAAVREQIQLLRLSKHAPVLIISDSASDETLGSRGCSTFPIQHASLCLKTSDVNVASRLPRILVHIQLALCESVKEVC